MSIYAQSHYRSPDTRLQSPLMIVVHDTETADLKQTLDLFKPVILGGSRPDLGNHGEVNVSIHFVVDADGTIYQLLPTDQMARHIIGFNYTSIGIENVAKSEKSLTSAQLKADTELIAYLSEKWPSIKFLIGHHEYRNSKLPHFLLWRENDPSYTPTAKVDPGARFMVDLRKLLHEKYRLDFLD